MNQSLIIVLVSSIIGIHSLLVGFGLITLKKDSEKSQEDLVKIRKKDKIIGFLMILVFSFYLFKYIYTNV